ncbi:MATE family efflux transporter [Streptomyces sp. NPDC020731]|uniref:MATE family efflux transporter n=1 Tax=Streptomyces sp. NPDC020731 TaxID=3365085 RepID=UPI0037B5DB32
MAALTRKDSAPQARKPSLIGETVRLSGSILVGLLAGLVLQVWTLAFLGRLGSEALYIRAIYAPVGFLVLAVTEGLVVAAQVSAGIATRNGRRDVLRSSPTHIAVGGGVLLLTAAVFAAGSDVVFGVLGVEARNRSGVVAFVVAVCLTSVVSLLPYVGGAALRGMGRAGASSLLSVGFTLLTMAATASLNAVTGLGVLAVPIGTLVAGAVVGAVAGVLLREHLPQVSKPWLRRDAVVELRSFGAPVAATFLLLSSVNFGYLWVLRDAGTAEIAGFGLGQNATSFFTVVALAVGSGAAVAVNLRPGEDRRPINSAGLTATVQVALPAYAVIGALAYLLRHPLAGMLTSDQAIAAIAADYFLWTGPTFALFGGTLALLTYLEQIGRASAAFTLNMAYFAVLLAVALCLPPPVGSTTLARLLAAGNIVGFATCWYCARHLIRRAR